jgi:hypothetical protein
VWTSIAVIVAALATGLIISTITASVGWPFLICFILGAVAASAMVHVRGLFLTVASIPLLFSIAIFITSWLVSRATAADGSPLFSTTILVTSAYPLLEVFPQLAITVIICVLIAVFRLYRAKQKATSISSKELVNRRSMAESNRRNSETTSRARKTTERLSVAELVERSKNNARAPRPEARRGSATSTSGEAAAGNAGAARATGAAGAAGATGARPSARRGSASSSSRASSSRRSSSRRGTAGEVHRVRATDESRRGSQRRDYRHGDISSRGSNSSRAARRVNEAQQNQERARRTQSFETRHVTDNAVNAAGSDRNSRLRPDPRRRAGDVRKTVKRSQAANEAQQPRPQAKMRPVDKAAQPPQAPKVQTPKAQPQPPRPDATDGRKRAPRALDEDLYGN